MRVGLVGTGYWANIHAEAISSTPLVYFAGVWGRTAHARKELAEKFNVQPFETFDEMVESVDILQFSVPPSVQPSLAIRAAQAGKHLLLEKPLALTTGEADLVVEAVERTGVAAIIFFTSRFRPEIEHWITEMSAGHWISASGSWISDALSDSNSPWAQSEWRWNGGGLWDLGPHALSVLLPIMGEISDVRSLHGQKDLVHLLLAHQNERTSTVSFSLCAPTAAQNEGLAFWGPDGHSAMPQPATTSHEALVAALEELVQLISTGQREHRCSAQFARNIVHILESVGPRSDSFTMATRSSPCGINPPVEP